MKNAAKKMKMINKKLLESSKTRLLHTSYALITHLLRMNCASFTH